MTANTRRLRALSGALATLALASGASAGTFTITLTGTISNTSGDFIGQATIGHAISATIEVDDAVVGTFTPSPNPTFQRSEMLYAGAIVSSSVTIDGNIVSGTGGDIRLLDAATGQLAGEDNYEVNAVLGTGTVGSATPATVSFIGEYGDATFTVGAADPLAPPPTFDPIRFNPYTVVSTLGGTVFGQLDSLAGSAAPSVPVTSPLGLIGLAVGLFAVAGVAHSRRLNPGTGAS